MEDLGVLVRRYELVRRHRGRLALKLFLASSVVMPLSLLMAIFEYRNPATDGSRLPYLGIGVGVGCLLGAVVHGWKFFRSPDEAFELYEGGLVRVSGSKHRVLRWEDVASIRDVRANPLVRGITRAFGLKVNVEIKAAVKGRSLAFTSLVDDAEGLFTAVRRAVDDGVPPVPPT